MGDRAEAAVVFDGQSPWCVKGIGLCLLVAAAIELRMAWRQDAAPAVGSERDPWTAPATLLAALCLVACPVTDLGSPALARLLAGAGLALAASGVALRGWAIHELGGLFSPRLEVRATHALVVSGPYRRVRHPGYTGALIVFAGLALATDRLAALGGVAVLAVAVRRRAVTEEHLLAQAFGTQYTDYLLRTGRFFPARARPQDEPPAQLLREGEGVNTYGNHDDDRRAGLPRPAVPVAGAAD